MATAKKTTRAKSTTQKSSPKKATSRAKTTTAKKRAPRKAAPKKTAAPVEQAVEQPQEPTRYAARNLTGYEFGFRLERQSDKGKKRTDLKPRGQRGDFVILQDGDLDDPGLQDQVNVGAIEIITAAEATKIAQKQTTNQQKVHPALAMIRNEYGEEYEEGAFHVDQSFEDQGVVVARLNDGQIAVGRGGIDRTGQSGPEPEHSRGAGRLRRPGGAPASSSLATQVPTGGSNATAANVDAKARIKGLGGPSAGLPDGIQVTVAPTQQT
jgi:hypothetical protein